MAVDALVVVATFTSALTDPAVAHLNAEVEAARAFDASFGDSATIWNAASSAVRRVVFAPLGDLDRDYDDVRRFADATADGIKRAVAAGAKVLGSYLFLLSFMMVEQKSHRP